MPHLIILDASLKDKSGHAYEYLANIVNIFLEKKWGISIYVNLDCQISSLKGILLQPTFKFSPTDQITRFKIIRPFLKILNNIIYNGNSMRRILYRFKNDDDIIFIQHIESYQLFGIFFGLKGFNGKLILMLRSRLSQYLYLDFRSILYHVGIKLLSCRLKSNLYLITDSEKLKIEYKKIITNNIEVFPIPLPEFNFQNSHKSISNKTLNIIYSGRPSIEKGINLIPDIIKLSRINNIKAIYHIHFYHNDVNSDKLKYILAEIYSLRGHDVIIYDKPLSSEEYWAQLINMDIILLLYDRIRYQQQTSGLLLDSLAAGVFPISTAGTWMESIIIETDFGFIVDSKNDINIASQVIQAIKNGPKTQTKASKSFIYWHTSLNFYKKMISTLDINCT
jgi:glycosyltransferase involved in cell wall biosynthesis